MLIPQQTPSLFRYGQTNPTSFSLFSFTIFTLNLQVHTKCSIVRVFRSSERKLREGLRALGSLVRLFRLSVRKLREGLRTLGSIVRKSRSGERCFRSSERLFCLSKRRTEHLGTLDHNSVFSSLIELCGRIEA